MKKLFFATIFVTLMALMSTSVFAAESIVNTTYVCPNGNISCVNNGACIINDQGHYACVNNGVCLSNNQDHSACIYNNTCLSSNPDHAACVNNNVCLINDQIQYNEGRQNSGVSKQNGNAHRGSSQGRGHHGGNRCH